MLKDSVIKLNGILDKRHKEPPLSGRHFYVVNINLIEG
nr:MAG TPA: hypothetical protein [Caudoviricetes sp.]